MNTKISDLMTPLPHTIGIDIPVQKAKEFMSEYRCHHLPVLDGGKLVGVISDRDIKLVESVPNGLETPVEEVMTDEPVVVHPDTPLKDVVDELLRAHINSVIVLGSQNNPWGIFTSTNALEHLKKLLA